MTTGALIFAYNNEAFDYVRMAAWAAGNIRRHLGIPVALVTDHPTDGPFDQVILDQTAATDRRWFSDVDQRVMWNNASRPWAYDLTPWDRTLLLDADYVVASDRLHMLLEQPGLICHDHAQDVTHQNDFASLNRLGRYAWPLCWATVVVFDRSDHARLVFDSMKMIRTNWSHYQHIYRDRSKTYRNDHALTIALGIVEGHGPAGPRIPWPLATTMPDHRITQTSPDCYRIDFMRADGRSAWIELNNQDFHAMGKRSLMDLIA